MDALNDDEDNPFYMYELKKILREDMMTRCDECLNWDLYFTSPFFDEKYKNLKFLEEAKRYEIVNDIEDEVKECLLRVRLDLSVGDTTESLKFSLL